MPSTDPLMFCFVSFFCFLFFFFFGGGRQILAKVAWSLYFLPNTLAFSNSDFRECFSRAECYRLKIKVILRSSTGYCLLWLFLKAPLVLSGWYCKTCTPSNKLVWRSTRQYTRTKYWFVSAAWSLRSVYHLFLFLYMMHASIQTSNQEKAHPVLTMMV